MNQNKKEIFKSAAEKDAAHIINFQLAMALETEQLKLDLETCTKGVQAVFRSPEKGTYHVIEVGDQIIGSLLIINEWSDWRNGNVWWIHSVYIEPEYRGSGLFSRFYEYIKNLVEKDPNIRGLRLYVDKSNHRAKSVYHKIGMSNQHYEMFEWMKTF